MTDEKTVPVVRWKSPWGEFAIEEDEFNARDPMRRQLRESVKDGKVPELRAEQAPEVQAPSVPAPEALATPELILGEAMAAGDDHDQLRQVFDRHGLDEFDFYEGMETADWLSAVTKSQEAQAKQRVKESKQSAISASAAVVEGGQAPGDATEGTLAEMQKIYDGEMGSLSDPKVAARLRALNSSMGKAKPDAWGRGEGGTTVTT